MNTKKSRSELLRAEFLEELSITSRKLRTLFDARVRAHGLTLARARTLIHLSKKDVMTQTELAVILEVEGPTLVRLLDGLERQGLTERRPVDGDRRAKHIALTEAGRRLAAEVTGLGNELREEVLAEVSEAELVSATRVFQAIAQKIATVAGCEPDAA